MYIDAAKVLAHCDRLAAWQSGLKPAPVKVEWDLTNVCSLGCQSCHFAHTHVAGPWATKARTRPMAYSDTGRMADPTLVERALGEMAAVGVRAVVWSGGGEPTLHPAFADLVVAAHAYGLEQGLYTLGGHIADSMTPALSRLSWAVVSLDCADAATYAQEKGVPASRFFDACAGLQRLTEFVPVVGCSFLLHAGNYTKTSAMLTLARSLGATYSTFRPTVQASMAQPSVCEADRSWVTEALPVLWELHAEPDVEVQPERFAQYRDWAGHGYATCHGIKVETMVTPDGRVWLCPNRRGMAGAELGDLRTESFAAIWAKHPAATPVCGDCRVMCRPHFNNQVLAGVFQKRPHEAFV